MSLAAPGAATTDTGSPGMPNGTRRVEQGELRTQEGSTLNRDNVPPVQPAADLYLRLQREPSNQEAWTEFVESYGSKIGQWCRHWNLQEADAEDISQSILLKL